MNVELGDLLAISLISVPIFLMFVWDLRKEFKERRR